MPTSKLPRLNKFDIFDISQPIASTTACFPGDVPFSRNITSTYEDSKVLNLSSITMSPHVGTHTDSPAHTMGDYKNPDMLAGAMPLDPFVGPVTVLDLSPMEKGAITAQHIIDSMQEMMAAKSEMEKQLGRPVPFPFRYLLKTQSQSTPDAFRAEYPYLDVDAIELLHARGAFLVGLDVPSVDNVRTKDLQAHRALIDLGMYWLENLDLSAIEPGGYFLVAAPLKLMETEAAPVRALLLAGLD